VSSGARVSEEPFGTLASVRQRERCLETDPLVGTVWPRMAGAVGRVMNVEGVRLFLGVRALRGAGGQRDPVLDVARGRPVQPLHVAHGGRDLVTFGSTPISSFVTATAADEH
jgi:hypothetical protein